MLVGAVQRLTTGGGDPVVQLQTNFGGGKTHSMLALYHLFSGIAPTELAGIDEVMAAAGASRIPTARRVVLVGNKISPGPKDPRTSTAKRFHGTVTLDATRVGRDASRIAEEVIAHLAGLVGVKIMVTLEIEAEIPSGASDQVVRTVTDNSRTLKFSSQGFEKE